MTHHPCDGSRGCRGSPRVAMVNHNPVTPPGPCRAPVPARMPMAPPSPRPCGAPGGVRARGGDGYGWREGWNASWPPSAGTGGQDPTRGGVTGGSKPPGIWRDERDWRVRWDACAPRGAHRVEGGGRLVVTRLGRSAGREWGHEGHLLCLSARGTVALCGGDGPNGKYRFEIGGVNTP